MSEPTSVVLAILLFMGGIAASIDPHLLSGAFVGGGLFVLLSTEYTPIKRICLMVVSIAVGYLAAPEVQHWLDLRSGVVPAIIISALGVGFIEVVRRASKKFDLLKYLPNFKE